MGASISPGLHLDHANPSPVWGWKMLAVIASANTAQMLVQDLSNPLDGTPRIWTLFGLLTACGIAEYSFGRRWTPLRVWRVFVPVYAFLMVYFVSALVVREFASEAGPRFGIVITVCGLLFFVASVIALARRAQFLGPDRIPFGGRKPSLT